MGNNIPEQKTIGWEEWCALPQLGLPAIKAKVDTGAKTSALHAYDIVPFKKDGKQYVEFKVHPLQKNEDIECKCTARLIGTRVVTSSNGERETRYVILTKMKFGTMVFEAELTLTSRHNMTFRMLLGRQALRQAQFIVDPAKSYTLGRKKAVRSLYQ
jgi:ribosomal protein S6--L-glutamate ligase